MTSVVLEQLVIQLVLTLLLTQQLSLIPHSSLSAEQNQCPPVILSPLHHLIAPSAEQEFPAPVKTLPNTETCSCKHHFSEGKIKTFLFFRPGIIYTVSINRFKASRHAKKSSKGKDSIPEIQPRQTQSREHPLASQNHGPEGARDYAPMP